MENLSWRCSIQQSVCQRLDPVKAYNELKRDNAHGKECVVVRKNGRTINLMVFIIVWHTERKLMCSNNEVNDDDDCIDVRSHSFLKRIFREKVNHHYLF